MVNGEWKKRLLSIYHLPFTIYLLITYHSSLITLKGNYNEHVHSRFALWLACVVERPGLHAGGSSCAGFGDRREHSHFLGRQLRAAACASLRRLGTACDDLCWQQSDTAGGERAALLPGLA